MFMRVALALEPAAGAIGDAIRQYMPDVEIVREVPYANRAVLNVLVELKPDAVIVSQDVICEEDLDLRRFVFGLRQANLRVILLAYDRPPGDPLLSDMVAMGVFDLVTSGQITVDALRQLLERPAQWSEVSQYLIPGRQLHIEPLEAPVQPAAAQADGEATTSFAGKTAGPEPSPAPPARGVTAVVGLGPPGTGVTTVAINLAALWGGAGCNVALVDLDPEAPSVAVHLRTPLDAAGLVHLASASRPSEAADQVYGIWVYSSPVFPDEPFAARMNEQHVVRLVDTLRREHDRIVVDVGHRIDHPAARTVLQLADEVFIVADLDPYRTVAAAQRWPVLAHMTAPEKCRLVVNRVSPEIRHVDAMDVVGAIDGPQLAAELPLVPQAVDASIKGKPLALWLNADHAFIAALQALVTPVVRRPGIRWPWRR